MTSDLFTVVWPVYIKAGERTTFPRFLLTLESDVSGQENNCSHVAEHASNQIFHHRVPNHQTLPNLTLLSVNTGCLLCEKEKKFSSLCMPWKEFGWFYLIKLQNLYLVKGTETILSLIMYEMFAVLWYLLEVIYSELISVNFARSAGKLSLLSFDFSMLRSFSLCVARSLWIWLTSCKCWNDEHLKD